MPWRCMCQLSVFSKDCVERTLKKYVSYPAGVQVIGKVCF